MTHTPPADWPTPSGSTPAVEVSKPRTNQEMISMAIKAVGEYRTFLRQVEATAAKFRTDYPDPKYADLARYNDQIVAGHRALLADSEEKCLRATADLAIRGAIGEGVAEALSKFFSKRHDGEAPTIVLSPVINVDVIMPKKQNSKVIRDKKGLITGVEVVE